MTDLLERFVLNPADVDRLRSLRDSMSADLLSAYGAPAETIFGVPFITSPIVPPGQILRVRVPREPEPIPVRFDEVPFSPRYFGLNVLDKPNYVVSMCEGDAPVKRLTTAQRRRRAKRFIREEIARRRMERRTR